MQIGFIGIGVMGRPMTLNLLKAGNHVTIFARHPEKPEVQEVLACCTKTWDSRSTLLPKIKHR
jgi:3-hydroxyisobutyrate dehydrogenase-like beta-hydroxyacid dehydrogenase